MIDYLNLRDLVDIASELLNMKEPPVRDWGLLESAAARPRTSVFGTDAYPTLDDKVAAMMHSIARNHALVDGNKRLAFLAGYTMYAINGFELIPPNVDKGEAFVLAIARGELEIPHIAQTLKDWTHTP